jgi:hypothetical protein
MQLTDKQGLLLVALLIAGSYVSITLLRGTVDVRMNLGGFLVPVGTAIYVLGRAGTGKEWGRAILSTLVTTGVLYGIVKLMAGFGHGRDYLDPIYIYGIVGGLVAYIAGRSRRSAFISAVLGVLLLDVIHFIELMVTGQPGQVILGGAGAFDAEMVAGVTAVLLAELIGESRERLQGGPSTVDRPVGLTTNGMDGNPDEKGDETDD